MKKVICFDLDDTLHKEINYLHAAYRLIAKAVFGEEWEIHYRQMLQWYEAKEDVFQKICDMVPSVKKAGLLNMYRYDVHELMLPIEVDEVLLALKASGAKFGLITDGRSLTQRNKIQALGLGKYFADEDIVISEEFGSEKPSLANYEYFMQRYSEATEFVYVGDNPKKDFVGANALGWTTVCLLDDGRNIHKQDFFLIPAEALPKRKIKSLKELI